jgi:hypothetical protein
VLASAGRLARTLGVTLDPGWLSKYSNMFELVADFGLQLVLSLVAAGLAIPFVLARRRMASTDRERLALSGIKVSGRVLKVWKDAEGWNVTYEFTPLGQSAAVRKTESFEGLRSAPTEVGACVEVAHEATAPFYSVPLLAHRA